MGGGKRKVWALRGGGFFYTYYDGAMGYGVTVANGKLTFQGRKKWN